MTRRLAALLVAVLAALTAPAPAAAQKSYALPQADVELLVAPDGSLRVEEHITFAFSGAFTGAYRDVPIREGEAIDGVVVSENGVPYRPGASAELGSSGAPGTFGTARLADALRIVWHYRAVDEVRTFTITYRFRRLAVAYDDVVDVNFKVWGDHWPVPLGRLTATLVLPGDAAGPRFRAWGRPVWVRGDVQLAGDRVLLRALDVPSEQFVDPARALRREAGHDRAADLGRSAHGGRRRPGDLVGDAGGADALGGRGRGRRRRGPRRRLAATLGVPGRDRRRTQVAGEAVRAVQGADR